MCWSRKGVPGLKRSGEAGGRAPPASGQLQSQILGASGQQGLRIGGRLMNEDPTDPPSEDPQVENRRSRTPCAALPVGRRGKTSSGCKERRQVVLDQAWLTDARLLAKHRRQARRSPHRPVTGEDLLAAGKQDALPGRVGVFVRARVFARGVVGGEGLVSRLDQRTQRALA